MVLYWTPPFQREKENTQVFRIKDFPLTTKYRSNEKIQGLFSFYHHHSHSSPAESTNSIVYNRVQGMGFISLLERMRAVCKYFEDELITVRDHLCFLLLAKKARGKE